MELQHIFMNTFTTPNCPSRPSKEMVKLIIPNLVLPFPDSLSLVVNVCIGKEWYRFPSNFFLPEERFHLQFIKSSFTGELPKPYAKEKPTSSIPSHMNHLNMEEPTRYVCILHTSL